MKHKTLTRIAISLWLMCAFFSIAAAQTVTGSLVGHIEDANGAVVPGARVVATDVDRGTKRETVTNDEGNYSIDSVDPGVYRIEIEQASFKKAVLERVEIRINSTVRADAKLEIGQLSETVQITSDAIELKTDRSDLSTQITSQQIQELPLSPDRNYQSLLELGPGVSEAAPVGSAFGNPGGSVVNRVNGQNERNNSFQLDGTINNQTNVISQTAIVPPPEAIQVVDVGTNAYDAESGRATGAAVNVQIKSGTNKFHGDAFYYNTNSALGARNYFSTLDKPHTNLTQVGFVFAGPIIRDKTFFFGDFQAGRDRQGQSALLSVPTAAYRSGDFSSTKTQIFDPSTGAVNGTGRTAFAGNIIPQNRISPVARAILSRLPLPNLPGQVSNYEASGSFAQDRNSADIKVNHVFSQNTNAFARYSFLKANTSNPGVFGVLGGPTSANGATAAVGPSLIQSASLNLTHTFSPSLVTEGRFGLVRVLITGEPVTEDDLDTQVGIPGINDGGFFNRGLSRIGVSGYTFLGSAATLPFKIAETSFNVVSNWTKTYGNHTIRFGGDVRDLILNKAQAGGSVPRGEFTFATGPTSRSGVTTSSANAFAAFLLGLPTTISRTTVNQLGGYRQRQYFFFVQDRWQVSSKLTLNYGLRYEVYPYSLPANPGDQARYDPATNKNLIAGYGPVDNRLGVKTDYSNFAPRLGLAYRILDKTVIRAGYGIGYIPLSINSLVTQNYPGQVDLQVTGVNSFQAAGNIANGVPKVPNIDPTVGVVTPPNNVVVGVLNPNSKRGYVQSFNATIEQEFHGFVGEISYVGTLGTRLPGTLNLNAAGPGAATADRPFAKQFGRTADVLYNDYFLGSSYHALQAHVERRWRDIGSMTASYTLSKALDFTDAFALQNDLNLQANRGLCDCDRTHAFVVSHVLYSPFGQNKRFMNDGRFLGSVLGGWTLSGVFTARSGNPIDITGVNLTANKVQGTTARPNTVVAPSILGGTGPGQKWFDTTAFVEPVAGTFGNTGRNSVRGPGYVNYNATVARTFALGERMSLRFTASAFNVTNTPRFDNPSGSFTSSAFGEITNTIANSERRIRFGLKLSF
jgi:outer membrane receptor protein involved in Fe transport